MKVLVVDDDPMAGMLIGAVIEDMGYQVLTVDNGVDAAQTLDQEPDVGLIVSDMHMPFISGIELFQSLREQGVNIPFILLTGNDVEQASAQAPDIDACLKKSDDLDEVLPRTIHRVLGA